MDATKPDGEGDPSFRNRAVVMAAQQVGCFSCITIYEPSAIREWTDEDSRGIGQTAICPRCDVDAVIPISAGVDAARLAAMHDHYFFGRS